MTVYQSFDLYSPLNLTVQIWPQERGMEEKLWGSHEELLLMMMEFIVRVQFLV